MLSTTFCLRRFLLSPTCPVHPGVDTCTLFYQAFIKSNRPHVVCVSTSAGYLSRQMLDTLVDRRSGQNGEPKTGVLADALKEFLRDK